MGEILKLKDESMHIVMTGQELPEGLRKYVDRVTTLSTENISNNEIGCRRIIHSQKSKGGRKMAIFKGAGVAIVTPMHENGGVNYDKLGEMIEFQIANSTDAIIICGTTGESSTMTHGEHLQTIKYAIDKVAKRVPVIAGTGSNCTETAVMMSKEAALYGADALLVVTPYYIIRQLKGLIAHYTAIAEAIPETRLCRLMFQPVRAAISTGNSSISCEKCEKYRRN